MHYTKLFLPAVAAFALGMLVTACDDKYDLEDIDTTSEVNVNDLTLPVNLDPLYLKNIIRIKDDSDLSVDENGNYCFSKNGVFSSSDIEIDPIHLDAPVIDESRTTYPAATINGIMASGGTEATIDIQSDPVAFTYSNNNVSADILSMDEIGTTFKIIIHLDFAGLPSGAYVKRYRSLSLQLPPEMTATPDKGTYHPSTGVLDGITSAPTSGNALDIEVTVSAVKQTDGKFDFNAASHTITFRDNLRIISGHADINIARASTATLPVTFITQFNMTDIDIDWFTGRMHHSIDGFDIPDINLGSLPGVIAEQGTDVTLVNPQIYLSLNNPAGQYGLKANSGMTLTPHRDEGPVTVVSMPALDPAVVDGVYQSLWLPAEPNPDKAINYMMASDPKAITKYLAGYDAPYLVHLPNLEHLLSGNGIPYRISITLDNPSIPDGQATRFPVGRSIGKVDGRYTFYAPLSLAVGSIIAYADTVDGWSSEFLDDLTITELTLSTKITNNAPIAVKFSGHPIDTAREPIYYSNADGVTEKVIIEEATIPAFATQYPVTLHLKGHVKGLDGIIFKALGSTASTDPLNEDMLIKLEDLRIKVSGHYVKKF